MAHTYTCPLCHLRFRWAAELDGHARDEHQPLDLTERREHLTRHTVSGRKTYGAVYVPL